MKGLMQDWPLVISNIIDHAAYEHPEQEVVTRGTEGDIRRCTYSDIHSRSRRVGKALTNYGITTSDRIATLAWNTDRHLESWYGITGAGAIYHTVNPRLFPEQINYIINHAEDRLVFLDTGFLPILENLRDSLKSIEKIIVLTDSENMPETTLDAEPYEEWLADYDDDFEWKVTDENLAAGLCYTSGTTGNPKGVLYSHRSNVLHSMAVNTADIFGLKAVDVVLPVVPMFHANAWGLAFACPSVGAKMVMPGDKLDGQHLFELLKNEKVSFTAGVPTVWMMLIDHMEKNGEQLPDLQKVVIGGSACPKMMIEKFEKEYDIEVSHAWGMTEMSPLGTVHSTKSGMQFLSEDERLEHKLKQGRVAFSVEMKIVDDDNQDLPRDGIKFGKLKVRGPTVVQSYFKSDDNTQIDHDNWFDTGDMATIDEYGFLQITDRAKDVIKSGGEWISSIDLENAAVGHPGVTEAAVIAVSHPKWAERPLMVIVKKDDKLEKTDVMDWLTDKVAKWWLPDDIVFVDEIPHTATGKIQKLALREQFRDYQLPDAE